MDMDTTLTWPYARPTKDHTASRTESVTTYRPMTDCFFRTDGNSQGTIISSLASSRANEVIIDEDDKDNKDYNADEYREDDMDQFAKDMENTDDIFDFTEEEDVNTKTTPTRKESEHDVTSPSGLVTEGSKTLVMDERIEKV